MIAKPFTPPWQALHKTYVPAYHPVAVAAALPAQVRTLDYTAEDELLMLGLLDL
jgi:hypothetical protein